MPGRQKNLSAQLLATSLERGHSPETPKPGDICLAGERSF